MKNKLLNLIIIFYFFFTSFAFSQEFIFKTKKIEITENGKFINATHGSAVSSENSLGAIDLSNPRVQAAARTMLRELAQLSGTALDLESVTLESLEITGRKN